MLFAQACNSPNDVFVDDLMHRPMLIVVGREARPQALFRETPLLELMVGYLLYELARFLQWKR